MAYAMVIIIYVWFIMALYIGGQLASEVRENYSADNTINGYVEVRRGVHLSYRLYFADGTKNNATDKPLTIWLQGDPGFAPGGLGNFGEAGPLSIDFKPKDHTWAKGRNLLFIDHPIGSELSYATNLSHVYSQMDLQMAIDLFHAIKHLLNRYVMFSKTPTYVIAQSFGGKLCPRVAMNLYMAIKYKSLEMNFKGIGIGGGWVNPKESILLTPNFLHESGFIDRKTFLDTTKKADEIFRLMENNERVNDALETTLSFYDTLRNEKLVNLYNIYDTRPYTPSHVFTVNKSDFFSRLIPSSNFLEAVLTETELKVAIYNGNLDALTPLAGTSNWVHKLDWPYNNDFAKARRRPMQIAGKSNGYFKVKNQLSFWTVFDAGHWVSEDNPGAMDYILEYLEAESTSTFMETVLQRNIKYFRTNIVVHSN